MALTECKNPFETMVLNGGINPHYNFRVTLFGHVCGIFRGRGRKSILRSSFLGLLIPSVNRNEMVLASGISDFIDDGGVFALTKIAWKQFPFVLRF